MARLLPISTMKPRKETDELSQLFPSTYPPGPAGGKSEAHTVFIIIGASDYHHHHQHILSSCAVFFFSTTTSLSSENDDNDDDDDGLEQY